MDRGAGGDNARRARRFLIEAQRPAPGIAHLAPGGFDKSGARRDVPFMLEAGEDDAIDMARGDAMLGLVIGDLLLRAEFVHMQSGPFIHVMLLAWGDARGRLDDLQRKIAAALASLGIILAAAYLLWMVQRVAFGVPAPYALSKLRDVDHREMAALAPLVVLVFWIGLFPNPLLTRMHASVEKVLARTVPPVAGVIPAAGEQPLEPRPVSTGESRP